METDNKLNKKEQLEMAAIVSRFNFGQEVWFLNGRHILNGTIQSIRGERNYLYGNIKTELHIFHSNGNIGCNFWIEENDCFETRQSLVDVIINGNKTEQKHDKL